MASAPKGAAAPAVALKQCACGVVYTHAEWNAKKRPALWRIGGDVLEVLYCACRSTITVKVGEDREPCGYVDPLDADPDGMPPCCGAPAVAATDDEGHVCEDHALEAHRAGRDLEDVVTGKAVHVCPECDEMVFGRSWGRCEQCLIEDFISSMSARGEAA